MYRGASVSTDPSGHRANFKLFDSMNLHSWAVKFFCVSALLSMVLRFLLTVIPEPAQRQYT